MKTKNIQHYTDIDRIKFRYSEIFRKNIFFNIDSLYQELTIIEIYLDLYEVNKFYGNCFTRRSFSELIRKEYKNIIGFIYFYLEGTLPLNINIQRELKRYSYRS